MSYGKIFSVVTEHTASTVVARYAISLAAACKASLVLYAAHTEGSSETRILHTTRHLDHLFEIASHLDIPVSRIIETGNIGQLLPLRVLSQKADLVFYPLTPEDRYGATLQRHVVHQLLRSIGPDLAIMRAVSLAKPHPRHILMPLGKTVRDSELRLRFISELAQSFHSHVTLFHLPADPDATVMPASITEFRKQLQQHVTVLERSGKGKLGKSITVEAITRHNDLIVLGASERGVLRRFFFGNPAGEVMHRPPCNAILFRPARQAR